MDLRPPAVRELLEELEQLPGVGPRTATRLVQHLIRLPGAAARLAGALEQASTRVKSCSVCSLLSEEEECSICRSESRDRSALCVVEDPLNAWAVEATGEFGGLYHVLQGTLDPLRGIGPEELTIAALVERVRTGELREVIVATNPTVEGEATAHYVAELLRPSGVRVTRIAFGLPAGGEISYADQVTLSRALAGRRGME